MSQMLIDIAQRIRELRTMEDISQEEMAQRCGVSLEEYQQYETGQKDFSFSFV